MRFKFLQFMQDDISLQNESLPKKSGGFLRKNLFI